jgi:Fe-Mn family superoxide dismutase
MEIHHTKHHNAYVTNLNNAIVGTDAEKMNLDQIISSVSKFSMAVRNNGGGHFNHSLFWTILAANGGGTPPADSELLHAINSAFGSFDKMKEEFNKAATTRFGSGWAWLIVHDGKLVVTSTPNQDNTLMDIAEVKGTPILGLDVWEHAYYLHYQNRRPDYINAFWNLINWSEVMRRYEMAK